MISNVRKESDSKHKEGELYLMLGRRTISNVRKERDIQ